MTWRQPRSDGTIVTGLLTVYPQHCDMMGHLTVKEYVGFFDQAAWMFFDAIGYRSDWRESRSLGWADIRHTMNYKSELRLGESAYIESTVTAIGIKSLTGCHVLRRTADETPCATLEAITVQFDLSLRAAVPLDPAIRAAAQHLLDLRLAQPADG